MVGGGFISSRPDYNPHNNGPVCTESMLGHFVFLVKDGYKCGSYYSIFQSVILPVVESKLMPTFVIGSPLRAKRWR